MCREAMRALLGRINPRHDLSSVHHLWTIRQGMSPSAQPRRVPRRAVSLPATCRTQSGLRDNARIADISPHGCRLRADTLAMRVGARIVIRPQGLEGVSGLVRWIDGKYAGIEFDTPLYQPVVDHLSRLHAAGDTVTVSTC
jgi:hypothetical protein